MSQITLYLDQETRVRVERAARAAGKSQSRWLADLVRETTEREWPDAVRRLLGSCPDFPTAERIRKNRAKDARRAKL